MQIIENNYKDQQQELELVCPYCKSKLKYDEDDIWNCEAGSYIKCPCCMERIYVDDIAEITLATVNYPETFYSFENGVSVKNNEINKWVKECLNQLDKGTDYTLSASGDTIVFAFKSGEDESFATVIVAKKYQECEVKISQKTF